MMLKFIAVTVSFFALVTPSFVFAREFSLIVCQGTPADPCTFQKLISLSNEILSFLLYKVAPSLAAIGFMVAGVRLILSQEKESAWGEAREAFWNIGKGFLIIIAAFTVVKFVLFQLLSDPYKEFVSFFLQ